MKVEWVESFCFWTLPTWSWENETEAHEPHIVTRTGQVWMLWMSWDTSKGGRGGACQRKTRDGVWHWGLGTSMNLLDSINSIYAFCVQEACKKHWEHGSELRQTPSAPPNLPGEVSQGGALQQLIVSARKKIEAATLAGLAATAAEKEPDSPQAPDLPCLSQLPANKNQNISKHFCQSRTKPQQDHRKTAVWRFLLRPGKSQASLRLAAEQVGQRYSACVCKVKHFKLNYSTLFD